jgi:hypothetical protein
MERTRDIVTCEIYNNLLCAATEGAHTAAAKDAVGRSATAAREMQSKRTSISSICLRFLDSSTDLAQTVIIAAGWAFSQAQPEHQCT